MSKGYDGTFLINILQKNLKPNSTILELGMGPGKDMDILSETYKVTGSDSSSIFIEIYKKKNKEADLLLLDAQTIETDRKFDCIYSNKVLIHLTPEELRESLVRQLNVLNDNGLVCHSFWRGNKEEEEIQGLKFIYYLKNDLQKIAEEYFDIIEMRIYKEIEANDSILLILKKK